MNSLKFNKLITSLEEINFKLTHMEKNFAIFSDGKDTLELKCNEDN